MKTVIDYEVFLTPGVIVGTTSTFDPISIPIRGLEVEVEKGAIAGLEAAVSTKIPSHTFLSYMENDLIMGMELTLPKIRKFDISEYGINQLGDHIVFVARPTHIEDFVEESLEWMKERYKEEIPYNVLGLFKFIDHDIQNEKGHEYCSQFVSLYLQWLSDKTWGSIKIPDSWKINSKDWMVSPFDVMNYCQEQKWMIPWTKEVDDSYSREEILGPAD
jgi:hypothetical protein